MPGYAKIYDAWQQKMAPAYAGEKKVEDAVKEISAVAREVVQANG